MFEELTAKIQRARRNLEVERQDSQKTQERYENELSNLRETHAKNLEHAEQDKMTTLAELSRKSKEARTKALELERARLQDTADEVQKKHEEEVAALEEQLRAELEAELKDGNAAHQSALEQKARDLDQMSAEHGEELADARREHKKVLAERDRNAQSLDKAIEQTKADHRERELLRTEHAESLAALRKELEALGQTHRRTLAQRAEAANKTLQEVEAERDEARTATDDIRAQLAESQKKHQTERQKLEETLETRLSELEDEKQSLSASLEKLERDSSAKVKRLSAALAREKQESRFTRQAARINDAMQDRHKREISELDARHAHDAKRAEHAGMKKLEHLERTLNEKYKNAAADRERQWTDKLETMRRDYETSDAALRKELEHEHDVSRHRSDDASRELAELKARLEALSQELRKARKEVGLRDELMAATVRKTRSRQTADQSKKTAPP